MWSTILYLGAMGIIGLVGAVWLNNYTPLWPRKRGDGKGDGGDTPTPGGPSSRQAPVLPKKPEGLFARHQAAAATTSAQQQGKGKGKGDKSDLLAMALQSPPELPKRKPMLNILHAPTLTQSFSPSPNASSAGATLSASPAPATSEGMSDEKMESMRKAARWELISSEQSYIEHLAALMTVYFYPLQAKANKGSNKINKTDFALLFSNVEQIHKFHTMLLPALKTSADGNVAAVIQAHADYLKMYTAYTKDYLPALQTMNKLSRNPDFTRFLKRQRNTQQSHGLDVMSYLIMPVQRVPRYVLLLRELKRYTPNSHPHSASLDTALAKLGDIAKHINESQRQHENASLLLEFQHQILNLPEEIQLFQPHRRLLRHGILRLVKQEATASAALKSNEVGENFVVILFNDALLYSTLEHDYRGWLPCQGASLNRDGLLVELHRPKTPQRRAPMLVRLECPSSEEADKWAASMRESIQSANELADKDERRRSAASSNSISLNH